MQSQLLDMALELFESATLPRTTVQTPFNWDTDEWRDNYMAVREGDLEALAREFHPAKAGCDFKEGRFLRARHRAAVVLAAGVHDRCSSCC